MHWTSITDSMMTIRTVIVLALTATLLTTAQSRVAVSKNDNRINSDSDHIIVKSSSSNNDVDEIPTLLASSSSSSSSSSSTSATLEDLLSDDNTKPTAIDNNDDDDNSDDDDSDEEFDEEYEDDDDWYQWPVLCPPNTYYRLEQDECTACTPCPANTYAIKACHRFEDNLCIPYASYSSGQGGRGVGDHNPHSSPKAGVSDTTDDSVEWKSVSLTLLIFTSVIFLCLVTVGSIFFYLRRRARAATTTKEILCSYSPAPSFPIVKVAEV